MAKLIGTYKGFSFYQPTSGGKAGKGYNVTSSIQVYKDGINAIRVKLIAYKLGRDILQRDNQTHAIRKAKDFIDRYESDLSKAKNYIHLIQILDDIKTGKIKGNG